MIQDPIHYPVYVVNPPRVDITYGEFKNLSYIGLAGFMATWKFAIAEEDEKIVVFMTFNFADSCMENPRFVGLEFEINETAEIMIVEIPSSHPLYKTVYRFFRNNFFLYQSLGIY